MIAVMWRVGQALSQGLSLDRLGYLSPQRCKLEVTTLIKQRREVKLRG